VETTNFLGVETCKIVRQVSPRPSLLPLSDLGGYSKMGLFCKWVAYSSAVGSLNHRIASPLERGARRAGCVWLSSLHTPKSPLKRGFLILSKVDGRSSKEPSATGLVTKNAKHIDVKINAFPTVR